MLHADDTDDGVRIDETEALEFTTVLAVGLATAGPGGLVMRTSTPANPTVSTAGASAATD